MPRPSLKVPAELAVRSTAGVVAALRDARAARLVVPGPDEHARRLLFGFTAPLTLLRVTWNDAPFRRSMSSRLWPPLMLLTLIAVTELLTIKADDRLTLTTAFGIVTSRVVKIAATLGVVEWLLVWVGREHHDHVAYEASVLTGVPGDPLPRPPRLRMDLGWLWVKAWRAARFAMFIALAAPIAGLVRVIPVVGPALAVIVGAAWTVYWAAVFAIANTSIAWDASTRAAHPWFMRALAALGRVPFLGLLARLYARVLATATRNVWPACLAFEETSWESVGLAAARAVASFPFFYIVTRPLFVTAATHVLVGRRSTRASQEPPE